MGVHGLRVLFVLHWGTCPSICASSVCEEPAKSKGFCRAHYARFIRGADVNVPIEKRGPRTRQPSTVCLAPGCEEFSYGGAKGYCPNALPADQEQQATRRRSSPACKERQREQGAKSTAAIVWSWDWGYCSVHYQRFRPGTAIAGAQDPRAWHRTHQCGRLPAAPHW